MTHRTLAIIALAIAPTIIGASCSLTVRTSRQLDGGVYRSDDAGLTWAQAVRAGQTKKNRPILIDDVDVRYVRFDPLNPTILYLGVTGAIYRTEDGGSSWVRTGIPAGTYPAFAIDPETTSLLYAATGGTILKSSDRGTTWQPIYYESKPDRSITDLAVTPEESNRVLAATSTGELILSTDFGNTWQLLSSLGKPVIITRLFFASGSRGTLYALADALYQSTDGGVTWNSLAPTLAAFPNASSITSIATLPGRPASLSIATGYGLLVTNDSGRTWTPIQTLVPFSSQPIQLVSVNPNDTEVIYVIVGNRLRKSIDGGRTWNAKITIPTSRIISTLALNPEHPDQLFLGTIKPRKR